METNNKSWNNGTNIENDKNSLNFQDIKRLSKSIDKENKKDYYENVKNSPIESKKNGNYKDENEKIWLNGKERETTEDLIYKKEYIVNPKYISLKKLNKRTKWFKFGVATSLVCALFVSGIWIWYGVKLANEETTVKKYFNEEINDTIQSYQSSNKLVSQENILGILSSLTANSGVTSSTLGPVVTAINDIIDTGRLSSTKLDEKYADKNSYESLINGRLSQNSLEAKYAFKNDFDNLQKIVDSGRLSATSINTTIESSFLKDVTIGDSSTGGQSADLLVTGTTTLRNTLSVASSSSLLGDVVIGNSSGTAANLMVTGTTALNSTLDVTGNVTFSSELDITGNATFSSELDVSGNTTFSSELDVRGRVTFSDELIVMDASTLLGDVIIGNEGDSTANPVVLPSPANLRVLGNVVIDNDLIVQNDITLGSLGDDNALGGTGNNADTTTTIKGTLDLSNTNVVGFSSNITDLFFYGSAKSKSITLPNNFGDDVSVSIDLSIENRVYSKRISLQQFKSRTVTLAFDVRFFHYVNVRLASQTSLTSYVNSTDFGGVGTWYRRWSFPISYNSRSRTITIGSATTSDNFITFTGFKEGNYSAYHWLFVRSGAHRATSVSNYADTQIGRADSYNLSSIRISKITPA